MIRDDKNQFWEFVKLVNSHYNMLDLLRKYINPAIREDSSILCPFHGDSRRSAKIYTESNSMYCWTCSKVYRPYDLLKFAGMPDKQIYLNLPKNATQQYNIINSIGVKEYMDMPHKYKRAFIDGRIDYKQYNKLVENIIQNS